MISGPGLAAGLPMEEVEWGIASFKDVAFNFIFLNLKSNCTSVLVGFSLRALSLQLYSPH